MEISLGQAADGEVQTMLIKVMVSEGCGELLSLRVKTYQIKRESKNEAVVTLGLGLER
jgi:hypothetical protein